MFGPRTNKIWISACGHGGCLESPKDVILYELTRPDSVSRPDLKGTWANDPCCHWAICYQEWYRGLNYFKPCLLTALVKNIRLWAIRGREEVGWFFSKYMNTSDCFYIVLGFWLFHYLIYMPQASWSQYLSCPSWKVNSWCEPHGCIEYWIFVSLGSNHPFFFTHGSPLLGLTRLISGCRVHLWDSLGT